MEEEDGIAHAGQHVSTLTDIGLGFCFPLQYGRVHGLSHHMSQQQFPDERGTPDLSWWLWLGVLLDSG